MKNRKGAVKIKDEKFSRLYLIISVFIGIFIVLSLFQMFFVEKVNAQPNPEVTPTPMPNPTPQPTFFAAAPIPPFYNQPHYECLRTSDCKPMQCMNPHCVNMFCQYTDKDEGAVDVIYGPDGKPTTDQCYCHDNPAPSNGMTCIPLTLAPMPSPTSCNKASDCGKDGIVCDGDSIQERQYFCNYPGTDHSQCLVTTHILQTCDTTVHNNFYHNDTPSTCQTCVGSGNSAHCATDPSKNGKTCFSGNTLGTCDKDGCKPEIKCNDPTIPTTGGNRYCQTHGNTEFIPDNDFDCTIKTCDPSNAAADLKGCVTTNAPDGKICKKYYDNSFPDVGIPRYTKCKNGLCEGLPVSGIFY